MSDASDDIPPDIRAAALARGVDPWALLVAIGTGDVRLVADLLGVDREELASQLDALARAGVAPERVASVAVLGA